MKIIGNENNWALKTESCASPKVAKVMLTSQCNLMCSYCYIKTRRDGYLGKNQLDRILAWDPTEVYLYGGEPTLYPDLLNIIRIFSPRPVIIQSNGIKGGILMDAARLGARVSISYHGKMLRHILMLAKELRDLDALESIEYMIDSEQNLKNLRLFEALFGDLVVPQLTIDSRVNLEKNFNVFNNKIMRFGLDVKGCSCTSGTIMRVFTPDNTYRCDQYMLSENIKLDGLCEQQKCYDSWCPKFV